MPIIISSAHCKLATLHCPLRVSLLLSLWPDMADTKQTLDRTMWRMQHMCRDSGNTTRTALRQRGNSDRWEKGGKKTMRTDHDNRLSARPYRPSCGGDCSCCFTCGFHALSGTSSFTCMTYVTTMRMLGTRESMQGVGAMLSRQNYLASPFAHCQHRLGVRQSIRHVHVQHLAEVTTVHCPRFTSATCNVQRTFSPSRDKVIC